MTEPSLADFLLARIAEDESAARSAIQAERPGEHWRWFDSDDEPARLNGEYEDALSLRTVEEFPCNVPGWTLPAFIIQDTEIAYPESAGAFRHIARHDPARVLAECEAKRRIVEEYQDALSVVNPGDFTDGCRSGLEYACHALASVWPDHPDYRDEWR